mgnify:CR=1 FL=1
MKRRSTFLIGSLFFGYAFLYLPIALLVVYSFNDSRIPAVWGGFSFRWYAVLFESEQVIDATLLSLRIAFTSATVATLFGTLAGCAKKSRHGCTGEGNAQAQ